MPTRLLRGMMKTIKSEFIRPALISAGYAALRKSRFHARKGNVILARRYRMCSRAILDWLLNLEELENEVD
jgi:hypothetical protein